MPVRLTVTAPNDESAQTIRALARALGLTIAPVQETIIHAFDITAAVSGADISKEASDALNYVAGQQNVTIKDATLTPPPPPPAA
jgi:TRAP-type uncharacterized transport system substrate-binding protein